MLFDGDLFHFDICGTTRRICRLDLDRARFDRVCASCCNWCLFGRRDYLSLGIFRNDERLNTCINHEVEGAKEDTKGDDGDDDEACVADDILTAWPSNSDKLFLGSAEIVAGAINQVHRIVDL